jgi:dihydroflavonol-4-reductase
MNMDSDAQEQKVNVLVTGGTGFFGHALVKHLLADHRVGKINVFARGPPPTEMTLSALVKTKMFSGTFPGYEVYHHAPEGGDFGKHERVPETECVPRSDINEIFDGFDAKNRIQLFYGDIASDEAVLVEAMRGCAIVFHACGDTRWWNKINSRQYATNAVGTNSAYNRAQELSVKRFIYTSTVDVMGHNAAGGSLDESSDIWADYSYRGFGYHYADSKRAAEEHLLTASDGNGPEVVIIRPGSMLGAWDVTDKYGRLFKELKNQSLAGIPPGGTSVCHVDDVARAHIAAAFLSSPLLRASGGVFITAGANVTYRELFHTMRRKLKGYKTMPSTIGFAGSCGLEVIPRTLLVAYGWLCEQWSNNVSDREPEINPGMARYMSCMAFYSSNHASKYLGYPDEKALQQRWLDAIDQSYNWYCKRGRI